MFGGTLSQQLSAMSARDNARARVQHKFSRLYYIRTDTTKAMSSKEGTSRGQWRER